MALSPGTRLGHYDVTALLGEGGMGQVWQATDTQLNRQVALKILPDAFAADPDRLARFTREAQILASLNHPNIAAIHGIEEAEGTRALVLELVEGPTLADRISKGPIPLDEALPIAKQIAEALEAAHEAGVIHRDLKPANIKVREDGTVKVLDFGLAKALDPNPDGDPSQSPTLTAAATQMGVIMGTAAYMSPEQAAGQTLDKRSDAWSFGVVLHEMLTGQRLFTGETVSHVLAKVLERELDLSALPTPTPAAIKRLLRRCLERKPKRRLSDLGEALGHLEEARASVDEAPSAVSSVSPVVQPAGWRQALPWVAGLVLAVVTGAAIWGFTRAAPGPVTRSTILLPAGVSSGNSNHHRIALSPDSSHLVYAGQDQLYLRALDQLEATAIPSTAFAVEPVFSPDGQWVAFWADGQIKKVQVTGGAPVTLCETAAPYGVTWTSDDTILFATAGGILRISGNGGTPEVIVADEAGEGLPTPQLLPGGEWVLFWTATGRQIAMQSLVTGERRVLVEGGGDVRYVPTGHLAYVLDGTLLAVPFNAEQQIVTGGPVPLIEGVTQAANGVAQVAFSNDGSLVYRSSGSQEANRTLVWVDRNGQPTTPVLESETEVAMPRLSPDGTLVAFSRSSESGDLDIWVRDLERGVETRLTETRAQDQYPLWSLDGATVTFTSNSDVQTRFDVFSRPVDLSAEVALVLQPEVDAEATSQGGIPGSWSPDGSLVFYATNFFQGGSRNIWILPPGGDPAPLMVTPFNERAPRLSPNGKWVVFVSDQGDEDRVSLTAFPAGGQVHPISTGPGSEAIWSRDGRELFYRNGSEMWVVDVETEPGFRAGTPSLLFEAPYLPDRNPGVGNPNYDVSLDGEHFLMVRTAATANDTPVVLVQNWHEELKRLVPVP